MRFRSKGPIIAQFGWEVQRIVFYLLAREFTRMDVAAVLASMYAAVTVILAQVMLKEEVAKGQWTGLALCTLAIAFIVL